MSERQGPIPDSYWVVPGRLLAGEYPPAPYDDAAEEKLALFHEAGVNGFIDLTEAGEKRLNPYAALVVELGMSHTRFPIRDGGCPTVDEMREILDAIDSELARGRTLYVHCYGGIGRTGTVVGSHLVRHGQAPEEALESIAAWRKGTPDGDVASPETPPQKAFILGWSEPTFK
jgi:protein-tyrosine phosphatase